MDTIPSFREVATEYHAQSDRLLELCGREASLTQRLLVLAARLPRNNVALETPPARKEREPSAGALALLRGTFQTKAKQDAAGPVAESDVQLARRLNSELSAVREAISILQRQMRRSHAEGSREYCGMLVDGYREVAGGLCAAVIALGHAVAAHKAYVAAITSQGASWAYLKPVECDRIEAAFGDPTERQSFFRAFLTGAAENGHFDLAGLPETWGSGAAEMQPNPEPHAFGRRARGARS